MKRAEKISPNFESAEDADLQEEVGKEPDVSDDQVSATRRNLAFHRFLQAENASISDKNSKHELDLLRRYQPEDFDGA